MTENPKPNHGATPYELDKLNGVVENFMYLLLGVIHMRDVADLICQARDQAEAIRLSKEANRLRRLDVLVCKAYASMLLSPQKLSSTATEEGSDTTPCLHGARHLLKSWAWSR